jgi:hypothetical protein
MKVDLTAHKELITITINNGGEIRTFQATNINGYTEVLNTEEMDSYEIKLVLLLVEYHLNN